MKTPLGLWASAQDLTRLAVWDGYNGTGTGIGMNGTPPGWPTWYYWSATPSTSGHALVDLYVGDVITAVGDVFLDGYVALQVLGVADWVPNFTTSSNIGTASGVVGSAAIGAPF